MREGKKPRQEAKQLPDRQTQEAVKFSFHEFVDFLLVISSFNPWWSAKMQSVISIFSYLFGFDTLKALLASWARLLGYLLSFFTL
ncbi:hypothetical protein STEG23_026250, partial [Scotinomys teguina]